MAESNFNPDEEGTLPAPTEEVPLEEFEEPLTLPASSESPTICHEYARTRAPVIAGYTAQGPLGKGTYGEVWLYQEDCSNRKVAIKFLTRQTTEQWLTLQAEVLQLVRLDGDPGIVQFKAVEVDADPPYYVMTYAEGGSLADRLKEGPLSVEKALQIFQELSKALAYVHAKGVRHCDLKPGNVLLDARDRPLLADFGQALLAENSKQTLGTLYFMAPEQAKPEKTIPDARWDIYSLGALFYTMVVGNPPRCQEDARKQLLTIKELAPRLEAYRHTLKNSPKPRAHRQLKGMDRPLADIIDRCLSLHPHQRYSDAGAVLEALERRKKMLRLKPFLVFGILAPIVLLVVLGIFAKWTVTKVLTTSEQTLTEQWQQNAMTNAQLLARILQEDLSQRTTFVLRQANQNVLTKILKENPSRAQLDKQLKEMYRQSLPSGFDAWYLVNAEGQLQGYAGRDDVDRLNFNDTDWFHGMASEQPHSPVSQLYVSSPYPSETRLEQTKMSIAVPIYDEEKILGILAAEFSVQQLSRWMEHITIQHGFAVLINDRCQYVAHPHGDVITWNSDPVPVCCEDCAIVQNLLKHSRPQIGNVHDPFDHKEYLTGAVPFVCPKGTNTHWGVMVQLNKSTAFQPLDGLRKQLFVIGTLTFSTLMVLTLGMWLWLFRAFRKAGSML